MSNKNPGFKSQNQSEPPSRGYLRLKPKARRRVGGLRKVRHLFKVWKSQIPMVGQHKENHHGPTKPTDPPIDPLRLSHARRAREKSIIFSDLAKWTCRRSPSYFHSAVQPPFVLGGEGHVMC